MSLAILIKSILIKGILIKKTVYASMLFHSFIFTAKISLGGNVSSERLHSLKDSSLLTRTPMIQFCLSLFLSHLKRSSIPLTKLFDFSTSLECVGGSTDWRRRDIGVIPNSVGEWTGFFPPHCMILYSYPGFQCFSHIPIHLVILLTSM